MIGGILLMIFGIVLGVKGWKDVSSYVIKHEEIIRENILKYYENIIKYFKSANEEEQEFGDNDNDNDNDDNN